MRALLLAAVLVLAVGCGEGEGGDETQDAGAQHSVPDAGDPGGTTYDVPQDPQPRKEGAIQAGTSWVAALKEFVPSIPDNALAVYVQVEVCQSAGREVGVRFSGKDGGPTRLLMSGPCDVPWVSDTLWLPVDSPATITAAASQYLTTEPLPSQPFVRARITVRGWQW